MFVSLGSSWLTDDDRFAVLCPLDDIFRRAIYKYWLEPREALNMGWRCPIEPMTNLSGTSNLRPFRP